MKVAIALDFLYERSSAINLVELLLSQYPDADLFTLAHTPLKIQGPVERCRIYSTFLSKWVHHPEDEKKFQWLIPSAMKMLKIDNSYEKVIIFSSGWMHALQTPPSVKRVTYLYDWPELKKGWFAPYLENYRVKAIKNNPVLVTSSQSLKKKVDRPDAKVIAPGINTSEHPFRTDEEFSHEFTHHLVYLAGLSPLELHALLEESKKRDEKMVIIGPGSEREKSVIAQYPLVHLVEYSCDSTANALTHEAKLVWDLSRVPFPEKSIGSFCAGRPVVVRKSEVNKEFLPNQSFLEYSVASDMPMLFEKSESFGKNLDRHELHRYGLRFNMRFFKTQLLQFVDKV